MKIFRENISLPITSQRKIKNNILIYIIELPIVHSGIVLLSSNNIKTFWLSVYWSSLFPFYTGIFTWNLSRVKLINFRISYTFISVNVHFILFYFHVNFSWCKIILFIIRLYTSSHKLTLDAHKKKSAFNGHLDFKKTS